MNETTHALRGLQSAGGMGGGGGFGGGGGDGGFLAIAMFMIVAEVLCDPTTGPIMARIFFIVFLGILACAAIMRCKAASLKHTRPTHESWLLKGAREPKIQMLSSSKWRGNYTQDGQSFFITDFELQFDKNNECVGRGRDNIGPYTLKGAQRGHHVALTKTYIPSQNAFHNRGHLVEIFMQATAQNRLTGVWYIDDPGFTGKMTFVCDEI